MASMVKIVLSFMINPLCISNDEKKPLHPRLCAGTVAATLAHVLPLSSYELYLDDVIEIIKELSDFEKFRSTYALEHPCKCRVADLHSRLPDTCTFELGIVPRNCLR
jgi:hypothetical protein